MKSSMPEGPAAPCPPPTGLQHSPDKQSDGQLEDREDEASGGRPAWSPREIPLGEGGVERGRGGYVG